MIIIFLFGAVLGSFLNVVILRSPEVGQGKGLVGRSACPHCHKNLRWWELVPIFSFLALRGKCQRCRSPVSIQYPAVELAMGVLAAILRDPILIVVAAVLIVLFVIDLYTMLLPDRFIMLLSVLVIVYLLVRQSLIAQNILGGIGVGAGFLLLLWLITTTIFHKEGIGLGDVKLMIPLGALFGVSGSVSLLLLAFWGGGLMAAYLLFTRRASLKTAVPFGPFLVGAAIALLIWPTLGILPYSFLAG